jgi:electron transport complex protein RnfA
MEYILIIISAIFVNNILLSQFLGVCPFLGVSNKLSTATGMSMAVCFVITLATVVTFLLNSLLAKFGLEFLQTISFILVIAALVQMVEIVLKKISPSLYSALGIFLPLITTNCAILGATINAISYGYSYIESIVYAFGAGVGYMVAMILFAGIREEKLNDMDGIPTPFKGVGIILVAASIMALSFMGFTGMFQ